MKPYKFISCALLVFFEASCGASAQVAQSVLESGTPKASSLGLDLNTPTAPGFVVIGASPKNVADPGNIEQFAVDTASFVEDGKLKPGLAISAQPFWMFNQDLTLEQYANSTATGALVTDGFTSWQRAAARTQVSLATVKAEGSKNKDAVKFGLGFQTELLDGRDPRNVESAQCVISAWQRFAQTAAKALQQEINDQVDVAWTANQNKPVDQQLTIDEISNAITEKAMKDFKVPGYIEAKKRCEKQEELRFLRSPSWMVGAGVAGLSDDGKIDDLNYDGTSFWSTFRKPFGNEKKALVVFFKADLDRDFKVAGNQTASGDAYEFAISYALEQTTWKLDATASYQNKRFGRSGLNEDVFKYSATAAYKLKEGVWFEATAGTKTNDKTSDENFGLVQLKTNLSNVLGALSK